jgi:RNA polymerase sigma factor (sigma-70 family)
MSSSQSTCWTTVRGAAAGIAKDRESFARHYVPIVRAYLGARWRGSPLLQELDDALQEVFVDCFTEGGALARVDPGRSFRAYFYGVIRIVALRHEDRRRRRAREEQPPSSFEITADEPALSQLFDKTWAQSVMEQAAARQAEQAEERGGAAQRRLELLALRFQEGLPIREIAVRWNVDAAVLHHDYARARREFHEALTEVVGFHHPGSPEDVEAECERLLDFFV